MDQKPFVLGLPWRLPHYQPMGASHPVVASFVQGNGGVRTIDLAELGAGVAAVPAHLQPHAQQRGDPQPHV